MNRVPPLLSISLLLAACGGGVGTREVALRVDGAAGRTAYFDRFENGRPYHVDSVKLDDNGAGTLNIPSLPLDFYRIAVGDEQLVVAGDGETDECEGLGILSVVGGLAVGGVPEVSVLFVNGQRWVATPRRRVIEGCR